MAEPGANVTTQVRMPNCGMGPAAGNQRFSINPSPCNGSMLPFDCIATHTACSRALAEEIGDAGSSLGGSPEVRP